VGPQWSKKSGQKNDNEFSYICLSGSCEAGKLMSEHYLLRFSPQRKLKRKYHVNEISSISSNFSNFSLTINFDKIGANQSVTKRITSQIDVILDPNNSSSSRTSASNQDSRTFYFQTLDECQKFSFELQKSIIQCNNLCTTAENKRDNKAVISGDALPVDQIKNLNELKDKFHERGEKLQKAVDNSERMRNSAQTFSNNARALRKQYSNSIWTSSK